jgi:hypothetical protein
MLLPFGVQDDRRNVNKLVHRARLSHENKKESGDFSRGDKEESNDPSTTTRSFSVFAHLEAMLTVCVRRQQQREGVIDEWSNESVGFVSLVVARIKQSDTLQYARVFAAIGAHAFSREHCRA